MKVCLTGASGYVGSRVFRFLDEKVELSPVAGPSNPQDALSCDLTQLDAVSRLFDNEQPEVVVHLAGEKNLGLCERTPDLAFNRNVLSLQNILKVSGKSVFVVYVSTDYVFSGEAKHLYLETDVTEPGTVYGQSKLLAEQYGFEHGKDFCAIRTGAIYDKHATFVRFLCDHLLAGKPIDCFSDAIYSPTPMEHFCNALWWIIANRHLVVGECLHVSGDPISRYDFGREVCLATGANLELVREAPHNKHPFIYDNLSLNSEKFKRLSGLLCPSHRHAIKAMFAEGNELFDTGATPVELSKELCGRTSSPFEVKL